MKKRPLIAAAIAAAALASACGPKPQTPPQRAPGLGHEAAPRAGR
jgi:hypothetical protein